MKERLFIKKSKEQVRLEEFVRKQFAQAKCGDIEVQHTPLVTRIVLHTTTPGLIIGSGGERIKETVEMLKKDFGIENPQIDVQRIDNPDIDSNIVGFLNILEGTGTTEQTNVVIANAAVGLNVVFPEKDLKTCVGMAAESLKSGRALAKLKAVTT